MEQNITLQQKQGFQLKQTVLVLATTMLMPFFVHLFPPIGNVPLGAQLLPMFYAPFIAVVFFRKHVALIAALLAPTLNYLITGFPSIQLVGILTFELLLFVQIVVFLNQYEKLAYVKAPLAYVLTKVVSSTLLLLAPNLIGTSGFDFFVASISTASLGLVILLIISIVAKRIEIKS